MKYRSFNLFLSQITAFAALAASPIAHAADGTWLGTTGNWTDSGIWSGGTIANLADFTANFTGVDIATDRTITLNGNRTIGNITFTDATTPSNHLLITGSILTLDRTSGIPIIDVTQANRTLTIASQISGSDGLQKNGTGTLLLSAANNFTGGLTINAGTVFVNPASGVNPLSSGKVTIGDIANTGASAELLYIGTNGNNSFNNLIDVRGNGTATIRVLGYNPTFSGAINLGNNLNVVSNNNFGSNIGFSGGVTGTGNLVIQSNAANGTTDSFITFSGSTLNFNGSITNSGTTTSATDSHTTISAVIGPLVTGITQNSANSNLILSGNNTFTGNIAITAGTLSASLAQGGNNPTSGALGNASTAGRQVTIASGGTLSFNTGDVLGQGGTNNIALTLIANGGTIRNNGNFINSIGALQLNGGTLDSSGTGSGFKLTGTVTVGGSAVSTMSANAAGAIGSSSVITYDVGDAVVGSGSDLNVTAVLNDIFGTGGIIKTGAGTMTLFNVNTYTGLTRVDNGTLTLGHATNTLVNTGAVNVNGGTLALGTNTDTVGAVTLTSGSITGSGAGTLTGTGSAYDVRSGTISARLGGTVGLTKTTAGTVTISSVSTYTGATNVNGGTLIINGNISTSSLTTVGINGTLSGSGTVGMTLINGTLAVGNSPGQMNFTNTLGLNGNTITEIDGTLGAGVTGGHDFVNLTGAGAAGVLTYGGTMTLDIGVIFGVGTYTWNLFDMASETGTFATITLADQYFGSLLDADLNGVWDLASGNNTWQFTESTGVLGLTVIPEPSAALLGALGAILLLRRRR